MSQRFYIPFTQLFTDQGIIAPGWKIKTYETGTNIPLATYSDEALTSANPNPANPGINSGSQVADINGRLGNMYVSDRALYKLVMTDENDVIIQTTDPVDGSGSNIIVIDPLPAAYWGITAGGPVSYTLDPALVPIASYTSKQCFFVDFNIACGNSPTLNVNNIGALNLVKGTGQGVTVNLQAGDVGPGNRVLCTNNGSAIVVLNPRNQNIYTGQSATQTIASGVVALTNNGASYVFDTEGGASSDDLTTINSGAAGQIIYITSADSARNIVVKNASGNIILANQVDFTIDNAGIDILVLRYDGTNWREISRSNLAPGLSSLSTNGYAKYTIFGANGVKRDMIQQWGVENGVDSSGRNVTFPIAFPNSVYNVQLTATASTGVMAGASSPGLTGFFIEFSGASAARDFRWTAIGY